MNDMHPDEWHLPQFEQSDGKPLHPFGFEVSVTSLFGTTSRKGHSFLDALSRVISDSDTTLRNPKMDLIYALSEFQVPKQTEYSSAVTGGNL